MRAGGFACRFSGCEARFPTVQANSLAALLEEMARRTAHELSAHDYHHVSPAEEARHRAALASAEKQPPASSAT